MHEAGLFTDIFSDIGQESDDIMLYFAFNLVNPGDIKFAFGPNRSRRFLRYNAQFGQRIGRMRLYLEPDLEFGFRFPNGNHIGARIARDHFFFP